MITFAVVDADGNTPADNPKLSAYKYMAMLQFQGKRTSLTCRDQRYTVESAGLAPMTFFKPDDRPYKSKCAVCGETVGPFTGVCSCTK